MARAVIWDIDPVLIQFDWLSSPVTNGPLQIRFYGVFFAIGLLGAAWAFPKYFHRWGFDRKHGERLTLWTPIAMIVGAHLIHLIFYETHVFTDFFSDPNALTWENLWTRLVQIGSGLASHGGGLGAILAVVFYARYHKKDIFSFLDPAMAGATFVIPWVRVGNFFNSEIVGREWDGPLAIYFPRHECPQFSQLPTGEAQEVCQTIIYRHPSQVYEAVLAFLMLGLAIYLQKKWRGRLRPGAIFFILLAYYFTTRFLIEFFKEYQTLSELFPLTMGQCLSLPIVLLSLYMLLVSKKSNILKPLGPGELASAAEPREDDDDDGPAKSTSKSKSKSKSKDSADAGVEDGEADETPKKKAPTKRKKKRRKKK